MELSRVCRQLGMQYERVDNAEMLLANSLKSREGIALQ